MKRLAGLRRLMGGVGLAAAFAFPAAASQWDDTPPEAPASSSMEVNASTGAVQGAGLPTTDGAPVAGQPKGTRP